MPNIVAELPDTYNSITRPAINQVVKHLIAVMRLPADTGIDFFGSTESQYQPQTTLSEGVQNKFPFSGTITVEATEQYIEDRTLTTAVKKSNEQFFFLDKALDVQIKPVYVGCEVTISFRYRAVDRTSSERWRDEFRVRSSQGRAEILHEFDYHIPVPKELLVILHEIHRLRENVAPYGEDLGLYMRMCLSERATSLTTQAGTKPVLAIAERQAGVVGWFEFVSQPEQGSKPAVGAPWETGFDYKFQYDKPVANSMHYPVIIHNQVLSSKYRQSEPIYQLIDRARRPNHERFLLDKYTSLYTSKPQPLADNRIPAWDDWIPTSENPNMGSLLTMLVGVGDDRREVLSLRELDTYELTPASLTFLESEYQHITTLYQSVFHVELYCWGEAVGGGELLVDSDLNLTTTFDQSRRDVHHVRISLVKNLSLLSKDALDRLRFNGIFALEVLKALYPKADLPELVGGQIVSWKDLINVIGSQITTPTIRGRFTKHRSFNTVGIIGIIAAKENL